jgi:acyl-CoA reductase-like NAD-dependent aldehyde dehydrogenase
MNTTIGPLVSQTAKENLISHIKRSVEKGAKIAYGALDYKVNDQALAEGHFLSPVIIENIDKT